MSIVLVGGGPDTTTSTSCVAPFINACHRTGASKIALFLVGDRAGSARFIDAYRELLAQLWDQVEVVPLEEGLGDLARFDAFIVAGGPVREYHRHFAPVAATIRGRVVSGAPYLGFSAGAMLASNRAILGGYHWNGALVSPRDWSEGVDDIVVDTGLDLVPWTVDVHAAQAGTLGRAMAVAARDRRFDVVALDENTALHVIGQGRPLISGTGHAWWVRSSDDGLNVRVQRATL